MKTYNRFKSLSDMRKGSLQRAYIKQFNVSMWMRHERLIVETRNTVSGLSFAKSFKVSDWRKARKEFRVLCMAADFYN